MVKPPKKGTRQRRSGYCQPLRKGSCHRKSGSRDAATSCGLFAERLNSRANYRSANRTFTCATVVKTGANTLTTRREGKSQERTPHSRAEFSFAIKFRLLLYHKHAATSRKIFSHGKYHGKKFDKTSSRLTAQSLRNNFFHPEAAGKL